MLAVSALHGSGAITTPVWLVAVGVALSVAVSRAGAALWAGRTGAGDTLFADLMLWGWVRRWRAERQLASAERLLGLREAPGSAEAQLSANRRVRLLKQLASGLEARLPDTHGHSRRVARHAATIAKRMGLAPEEVARIRTAAAVHDVGKVKTPIAIIEKPGPLTEAEFGLVRQHADVGAQMVAGLGDSELVGIVRHHHERFDGTGYPDGCAGAEIPLGARIVAVADTFDALTSNRPYRPAKSHHEALAVLGAEAGRQFDAEAVRVFRHHYGSHRPAAIWALLLNGPRQLIPALATEAKLGVAVSAAALASVAAGGVALPAHQHSRQPSPSRASKAGPQLVAASATGPGAQRGGGNAPHGAPASKQGLGPPTQGRNGQAGAGHDGSPGANTRGREGANSTQTPSTGRPGATPSVGAGPRDDGSVGGDEGGDTGTGGDRTLRDATSKVVSTVTEPVESTVNSIDETVGSLDVSGATSSIPDAGRVVRELPLGGAPER